SNYREMMTRYKQLLTYIKSAVTRNHSEKSINSILDYISTSKNMELLQDFYETTLEALKDAKNDRLWFKTNTKLGKLYFDRSDFNKLAKILKQLHQSCQTDEGEDDLKKGTQLLEIYALEIQMYTAQKNNKKLKTLYEQSLHIKSAIPHPLIMGVIRDFQFCVFLTMHLQLLQIFLFLSPFLTFLRCSFNLPSSIFSFLLVLINLFKLYNDCNVVYLGKTKRNLETCTKEHFRNIKNETFGIVITMRRNSLRPIISFTLQFRSLSTSSVASGRLVLY
ncbi:hypothetical protein L9F63_017528, partial [Diploptera punctata]